MARCSSAEETELRILIDGHGYLREQYLFIGWAIISYEQAHDAQSFIPESRPSSLSKSADTQAQTAYT